MMARMERLLRSAVLLVLLVCTSADDDCPVGCHCSPNQPYISCTGLTFIPETVPELAKEIFFHDCTFPGELAQFPPSYANVEMLSIKNSQVGSLAIKAFENMEVLHTLDLQGNKLENVDAVALKGLDNLKVLNLESNKLQSLDDDTFQFNPQLEELVLNNNHEIKLSSRSFAQPKDRENFLNKVELVNCGLTSVPTSTVCPSKVPRLVYLDMSSNNFTVMEEFQFKHAKGLTYLAMDSCRIQRINRETLGALTKLETLYLKDNDIEFIDEQAFDDFYQTLKVLHLEYNKLATVSNLLFNFNNLKVVNISHNPLHCGCENSWLQTFPAAANNSAYNMTCATPEKYQNQNALNVMKNKLDSCQSSGPNPMIAVYVAIPILAILVVVTIIIIVKICKIKRREKTGRSAQYSLVYKPTTEKA